MPKPALLESELDACLDSYESRLAKQGRAAVADFLPSREHPEYEQILCELIRVALEHEWLQGHATTVDEYLSKFPELREMPDSLQAICFEEYRQRLQFGEHVEPQTYAVNYGVNVDDWPNSLPQKSNVHTNQELAYPALGQSFLGFQLIGLLGRGTFAQVYLARQDELSQRPVALKVSRHRSLEAKRLARLQHTHIMPIYSVHQHEDWDVVCMPYLGARTLADMLADLRQRQKREQSTSSHETWKLEHWQTLPHASDPHEAVVARRQTCSSTEARPAGQTANEILELFGKIAQGLQHAHAFERQAQQLRTSLGLKPIAAVASNEPLSPRDLCQQALLLGSERRFREALPYWRKATLADPQNLWTWYGLGYCYEQLDQPGRAVECYSSCIALRPDYASGFLDRGRMRILQRDFDSACEDLLQAIKLEPTYQATLNLGIAYYENGRFPLAIESLSQAQKLGGDQVRVQMLLAKAHEKNGDKRLAAAAQQAAATEIPVDSDTWTARGVSLVAADPPAALNCFTSALQANPYSWPALESSAHVLSEKLDRVADAIQMLDLAVRLFPEKAACVANRGVLHARANHPAEALQDAESALAQEQSPEIRYQVACIHSLLAKQNTQHKQTAVEHLAKVLLQGYGAHFLSTDPDLAPLADDPQFQKLRNAVQALELQQSAD